MNDSFMFNRTRHSVRNARHIMLQYRHQLNETQHRTCVEYAQPHETTTIRKVRRSIFTMSARQHWQPFIR